MEMRDTELEQGLQLTPEQLDTFKRAYGEHWREIAKPLVRMNEAAEELRTLLAARRTVTHNR